MNEGIFLNNFNERLLQSIPSYKLDENEKNWIIKFIQSSQECFNNIEEELKCIISDGIIDLHDIPAIIKLFADVYYLETVKQDIVNTNNTINLIKFSLNVLLEPQFLLLSKCEIDIVQKVIDVSFSLLSMNLENIADTEKKIFKNTCCFY